MIDKPSPSFEMELQKEFKRFYLAGIDTGYKRGYEAGYEAAKEEIPKNAGYITLTCPQTGLTNERDSDKIKDASDGSFSSESA